MGTAQNLTFGRMWIRWTYFRLDGKLVHFLLQFITTPHLLNIVSDIAQPIHVYRLNIVSYSTTADWQTVPKIERVD